MCPVHKQKSEANYPRGFMHLDLAQEIIRQAAALPQIHIIPQGAGESFLHPQFLDVLQFAKQFNNITVGLDTNGSKLDELHRRAIIELGVDDLGISIDAFSHDTFAAMTGKKNYEEIVHNVEEMVRLRQRKGVRHPVIRVLLVETALNYQEVELYKTHWIQRVNEVSILSRRDSSGRRSQRWNFVDRKRNPCLHLWQTLFIQWNGNYDLCCDDWFREVPLPSTQQTGLRDFWFGPELTHARRVHTQRQFYKIPICARCHSWIERPLRVKNYPEFIEIQEPLIRRYIRKS